MNKIQIIKEKVNLADYISKYTTLNKQGNKYNCKCPFRDHSDSTPSFFIYDNKYKCFGCNRSGDILSFVAQYYNLNYTQVIEKLSEEFNIQYIQIKEQPVYSQNLKNMQIYKENLRNTPHAIQYLLNRGITKWADYNIGYTDFGQFANRLIFGITDFNKKICGFGARSLDEKQPKYINSSESEIFQKNQLLYHINTRSEIYIVEGYFDVLSLAEYNICAFATMGTATNAYHFKQIWKYCSTPCLIFDGDVPGKSALLKALQIIIPLLSSTQSMQCILLKNHDPDSFIRAYGITAWNSLPKLSPLDILWQELQGSPLEIAKKREQIYSIVNQIQDINMKKTFFDMLSLKRIKKFEPEIKNFLNPVNIIDQIFGILYKNSNLCLIFQYQIAILEVGEKYRNYQNDALLISEGYLPSNQWSLLKSVNTESVNPIEDLENLLFEFYKQTELEELLQLYNNAPTEKLWTLITFLLTKFKSDNNI